MAFHSPGSMYKMLDLPFGLCNAQATCQRVIDRALDTHEMLIFSPSQEDCIAHLETTFECLGVAGLQLCRDKCQSGVSSFEFLRHQISCAGREPRDIAKLNNKGNFSRARLIANETISNISKGNVECYKTADFLSPSFNGSFEYSKEEGLTRNSAYSAGQVGRLVSRGKHNGREKCSL